MLKYAFALLCVLPVPSRSLELNTLNVRALPPAEIAAVPAPEPAEKASYIQLVSSIKLKTDREKGRLTIGFPKETFGDPGPGDKAHLFVKITRGLPAPVISWATVLCSDGRYLGYKGSTIALPETSGSLSISETLALGEYPRLLIERTHPWLASGLASPDELCSAPFLEKMKDARAETLPPRLGDFSFEYNWRNSTLKVSWAAPR